MINILARVPIEHDMIDSIAENVNQKSKGPIIEAYNLSNGERTVAEIAEMVQFEYNELEVQMIEVVRILQALKKQGFIELS